MREGGSEARRGGCVSGRLDKMLLVPHLGRSFVGRNSRGQFGAGVGCGLVEFGDLDTLNLFFIPQVQP